MDASPRKRSSTSRNPVVGTSKISEPSVAAISKGGLLAQQSLHAKLYYKDRYLTRSGNERDIELKNSQNALRNVAVSVSDPTDCERVLTDLLLEVPGTEILPNLELFFGRPTLDPYLFSYVFEHLLNRGNLDSALRLIDQFNSIKGLDLVGELIRNQHLVISDDLNLSTRVCEKYFDFKIDLEKPEQLESLAMRAKCLLSMLRGNDSIKGLMHLIAVESQVVSDPRIKARKKISKQILAAITGAPPQDLKVVCRDLCESYGVSYVSRMIGRLSTLNDSGHGQLKMLRLVASAELDQVLVNVNSWHSRSIGDIAILISEGAGSDALLSESALLVKKTVEVLKPIGGLGEFVKLIESCSGMERILEVESVSTQLFAQFSKNRGSSTMLLNLLSDGRLQDELGKVRDRMIEDHRKQLDANRIAINAQAKKIIEQEAEINKLIIETDQLGQRLRKSGKDEIVARSDQIRQAQLQALIGSAKVCEELRLLAERTDLKSNNSVNIAFANSMRILNEFGVSIIGTVSTEMDVDRDLFRVEGLGDSKSKTGVVVVPAYAIVGESGTTVLLRGTMSGS